MRFYVPMTSVTATGCEVFGSCVEEEDVSVGMDNRGVWLWYVWKYVRLFWRRTVAEYWQ